MANFVDWWAAMARAKPRYPISAGGLWGPPVVPTLAAGVTPPPGYVSPTPYPTARYVATPVPTMATPVTTVVPIPTGQAGQPGVRVVGHGATPPGGHPKPSYWEALARYWLARGNWEPVTSQAATYPVYVGPWQTTPATPAGSYGPGVGMTEGLVVGGASGPGGRPPATLATGITGPNDQGKTPSAPAAVARYHQGPAWLQREGLGGWYQDFQQAHAGETPEEYYGHPGQRWPGGPGYSPSEGLSQALDDLDWSREWQYAHGGQGPTEQDWKNHWYDVRGLPNPQFDRKRAAEPPPGTPGWVPPDVPER